MNTGTPKSNNLGVFYTNIGNSINKGINTVNKGLNAAANSASETFTNVTNNIKNTPATISSLLPFKTNVKTNTNISNGTSVSGKLANVSNVTNATTTTSWVGPILVFIIIAAIFIAIFVKFQDKINAGLNNIIQNIRNAFNKSSTPPSTQQVSTVTDIPVSPQDEQVTSTVQQSHHKATNIIDKVLPQGKPEVFNVSENEYTYYDAEPLCRALGAELATYDQVKEAWSKGADWCNYGWVKGQAAVYPTQNETWEKIQAGPAENKNSCGVPGLNGGYFENPEMKFGVTCYGSKPPQSEHSQEVLMKEGKLPLSVPALEVDKKTQEFKANIDSIGVLPFDNDKWSNI